MQTSLYEQLDLLIADAVAVNPNEIKMSLATSLSTFPIKGNPVFSNGAKSLPKNPTDCNILCNWVFDNFILVNESFSKAAPSLETCVLVNDNLYRELFLSLE